MAVILNKELTFSSYNNFLKKSACSLIPHYLYTISLSQSKQQTSSIKQPANENRMEMNPSTTNLEDTHDGTEDFFLSNDRIFWHVSEDRRGVERALGKRVFPRRNVAPGQHTGALADSIVHKALVGLQLTCSCK